MVSCSPHHARSAEGVYAAVIEAWSSGCDPDDDSHDDHYRLLTLQPIGEILKFSNEIHNIKPFAVVFVDHDRLCCLLCHKRSWQDSQRLLSALIRDPRVIRDYLESHSVRKLQLGAGGNDPIGWLNTDIEPTSNEVYLDATKRYPFPDGSFQYVFSEHVIEYVPWEAGVAMLKECYRVLAPGGKLRVVTPNLAKFVQLLAGNPDADAQRFIAAKLRFLSGPKAL